MNDVIITRSFNVMRVDLPPGLVGLERDIRARVTARRKVTERDHGKIRYFEQEEPCYTEQLDDVTGRNFFVMGVGFLDDVIELAEKRGAQVYAINNDPPSFSDLRRTLPDATELATLKLRENQRELFDQMLNNTRGQFQAATGSGKSFAIKCLCRVLREARILITTYSRAACRQLFEDISDDGTIEVGMIGSGMSSRKMRERVQVCSIGMIKYAYDRDWDCLVLDEKHECATINRIGALMPIRTRTALALSANHGDKKDDSEKWLKAIFGDLKVSIPYTQVVEAGEVVPVNVHWERITADIYRPGRYRPGTTTFDRHAYWLNEDRNRRAVELAKQMVEERGQTIIYVSTVEHALALRSMIDCTVAVGEVDEETWTYWSNKRRVPRGLNRITKARLEESQDAFAAGDIKLAIANSVWKRAVNFPQLTTLIRLDASGTMEDATQITGRVNRHYPGKKDGLIIDFWDCHEDSTLNRSRTRKANYAKLGYKQTGDFRTNQY